MKKIVLFFLLALGCVGTQAQLVVSDHTYFLSFNAGVAYYQHSGTGDFGIPAGGISVGRWIMHPLAIRLAADAVMAPSYSQSKSSGSTFFLKGSCEFMWDINTTFFNVYNKNYQYPIPFYPIFGLGMVFRPEIKVDGVRESSEYDFLAMVGLHAPFRIAPLWDIFFEYKCTFLTQSFDGSQGDNFMHTATIGVTRRWADNPYRRHSRFESRSLGEDWFFGIGIGPNFSSFGFKNMGELGMYGITPELMFGRNFTEFWGVRIELGGLIGHERYDKVNDVAGDSYVFTDLHADLMMNVSNLIGFSRGKRLNVIPYGGAGLIWRYDDVMFDMQADAGVLFRYYLSTHSDLYADIKYMLVHPRIGGGIKESDNGNRLLMNLSVGIPSITFGYIYNFGRSTTRYRMPVGWSAN